MIRYHKAVVPLLVDADTIRPHPGNANLGDVDEIIVSITKNGCYRPIYASTDGTILAGHHLYAALLDLGATRVPVMFLDTEDGADESVRILLADNKIARAAKMDRHAEMELLKSLDDYTGSGYSESEVVAFIARTEAEESRGLDFGPEGVKVPKVCQCCGQEMPDE